MANVNLSPIGNQQFVYDDGSPADGSLLWTYVAGSTTPLTTYTDSTGLIAQTNPVILNALGLPTIGQIFLLQGLSYDIVWEDKPVFPATHGAVLKTYEDIEGINDNVSSTSQWIASGVTPTYISATSFSLPGDQTTDFHVGRREQFTVTAGTVYGTIIASAYTSLTTVTMLMDGSDVLDAGLSVVNHSILRADHLAEPFTNVAETIAGIKTFTSSPVVPTLAASDSSTKTANSEFVQDAIDAALPVPVELNFTSRMTSGNFTTPANITTATVFKITLVAGGAGGGGANGSNAVGSGGGAGGAVTFYITGLSPSTAYPVVIGAGGAGGSSSGGNGGIGGTTQITINGTVYSVAGGAVGSGTTTSTVNVTSIQGAISASIQALVNWLPIFQTNPNIGFASSPMFVGCNGGALPFGTNGIGGRSGANPVAASGYGVGGGGGVGATMSGGDGRPGLLLVEWVA